jgi:hypothetical protein
MELENNLILNKLFTKNMINELLQKESSKIFSYSIKRYIQDPVGKEFRTLISEIYSYMDNEYRNEYYYKNTLINKLLLERYSMKETTALTELPIDNSKADFVMINSEGIVYEIKTGLDNSDRLNGQINDYYKAFKVVYVVTCEYHCKKILDLVDEYVGIIILSATNKLEVIREAKENSNNLDFKTIFNILRKMEFESIITDLDKELPEVSQFIYYKECRKILEKMDVIDLQAEMLQKLKDRQNIEVKEYKETVPYELKFLIYFSNFRKKEYINLSRVLKLEFEG